MTAAKPGWFTATRPRDQRRHLDSAFLVASRLLGYDVDTSTISPAKTASANLDEFTVGLT
jgi:hypothetical protein